MDLTLRALNRFGLGARIGERDAVAEPRKWLRDQLDPAAALLPAQGLPTLGQAAGTLRAARRARDDRDPGTAEELRRRVGELADAERRAALDRRVATDTPYVERLVAFWSNHLCVSMAGNVAVAPLAGLYEREAIRPHVLGRYRNMVLASARHPAMLLYLDNARSIGPSSPAARSLARRRGRERGLNENYARELLELHTLGVDGGYEQRDVEELARLLTGWTVSGIGPTAKRGGTVGFAFHPLLHEPGRKRVLGRTYGEGVEGGEQAIADLCAHPSTARFLATKLVRHFVADEPPPRAVDEIAEVFRDSDGDLLAVSRALVELPEAWEEDAAKFRTPQEWIVAVGRAVRLDAFPPRLGRVLAALRHPLWGPPAPKGFDDLMAPWADPDSLIHRAELARSAADAVARTRLAPSDLLEVMETEPDGPLAGLLADRAIPAAERLALAIGGPAMQWR